MTTKDQQELFENEFAMELVKLRMLHPHLSAEAAKQQLMVELHERQYARMPEREHVARDAALEQRKYRLVDAILRSGGKVDPNDDFDVIVDALEIVIQQFNELPLAWKFVLRFVEHETTNHEDATRLVAYMVSKKYLLALTADNLRNGLPAQLAAQGRVLYRLLKNEATVPRMPEHLRHSYWTGGSFDWPLKQLPLAELLSFAREEKAVFLWVAVADSIKASKVGGAVVAEVLSQLNYPLPTPMDAIAFKACKKSLEEALKAPKSVKELLRGYGSARPYGERLRTRS